MYTANMRPPRLTLSSAPMFTISQKQAKNDCRTMTLPYLPFEIWEKIHSYLAPNLVADLIGVNRYFFEAAMDEIYSQVCISDADDEGQIKRLQQLQNPSISARVKHIKMTPYFLPQSDNDGKPLPQRTSSGSGHPMFLKKTIKILYNCKNLETLTIHLPHRRAITTHFHNFIGTLVSKAGSQLQKLSVNMTVMHFRLLDAFLAAKSWSPRVKVMELTIFPSYGLNESKQVMNYKPPVDVVEGFQRDLLGLLSSTRPSLESLHIVNYDILDLSALFTDLVGFSSLKEFVYQGHGRVHHFSDLQTLNGLLTTSLSLQHLSFTALSHPLWYTSPPVGYYEDEEWPALFSKNSFEFRFTAPNDLSIHLPEDLSIFDLDALSSNFSIFGPRVKHIAIKSIQGLTYIQFRQLLDWIAGVYKKRDGGGEIEAIEFDRLDIFSPVHLNEVLRQMRGLMNLSIGFEHLSMDPMIRRKQPSQSKSDFEAEVFTSFRNFEYVTSKLECLCLSARGSKFGRIGVREVQPRLLENLGIALPSVQVVQAFCI